MNPNNEYKSGLTDRLPMTAGVCMEVAGIESILEMDTPTANNYEDSVFRNVESGNMD